LGTLIPGSRKQKQLSAEEIQRMAAVYRQFKHDRSPDSVPGFCAVAKVDNIRGYNYALTPGRYVGASDDGGEDELFEERFPKFRAELMGHLSEADQLSVEIRESLSLIGNE